MKKNKKINNVLITGSARRIGRAIALDLANNGWNIIVHYKKSKKDAIELCEKIKKNGSKSFVIYGNLSKDQDVKNIIKRVKKEFGYITCLINNASEFDNDNINNMTKKSWERHMQVNFYAPILLSQKFKQQLPSKVKGNIINIVDQKVTKLTPKFLSYTLSKSGLWTATKILAMALAPNIRVNAIAPGPTIKSKRQSILNFKKQSSATILKRGGDPKEIGNAVKFILNSSSMTGQTIFLDGGQRLVWKTLDSIGKE